jgi:hypothetical protein
MSVYGGLSGGGSVGGGGGKERTLRGEEDGRRLHIYRYIDI